MCSSLWEFCSELCYPSLRSGGLRRTKLLAWDDQKGGSWDIWVGVPESFLEWGWRLCVLVQSPVVYLSFGQLDRKREPQLRNWLQQTDLRACLWDISLIANSLRGPSPLWAVPPGGARRPWEQASFAVFHHGSCLYCASACPDSPQWSLRWGVWTKKTPSSQQWKTPGHLGPACFSVF